MSAAITALNIPITSTGRETAMQVFQNWYQRLRVKFTEPMQLYVLEASELAQVFADDGTLLQPREAIAASDLSALQARLQTLQGDALLLVADLGQRARIVERRLMPALHLAWTQSSSKKATLPEPAAVPQPIKTAVLVGEFRQPASSYAADLAALGYQVETIEDQKQELPAHVDLVVYATKSRKPSWADAAVKRGKLAWSVSDLQEKVHNLRIRKGG